MVVFSCLSNFVDYIGYSCFGWQKEASLFFFPFNFRIRNLNEKNGRLGWKSTYAHSFYYFLIIERFESSVRGPEVGLACCQYVRSVSLHWTRSEPRKAVGAESVSTQSIIVKLCYADSGADDMKI